VREAPIGPVPGGRGTTSGADKNRDNAADPGKG
jgi:hypothetical protein